MDQRLQSVQVCGKTPAMLLHSMNRQPVRDWRQSKCPGDQNADNCAHDDARRSPANLDVMVPRPSAIIAS
jgi:hypothetical protein